MAINLTHKSCMYCEEIFQDGDIVAVDKNIDSLRYLHTSITNNREVNMRSCFFKANKELREKGLVRSVGNARVYVFYKGKLRNFSKKLIQQPLEIAEKGCRYSIEILQECLQIDD